MSVYSINQKFRAAPTPGTGRPPSDRQVRVAEMFGIGLDETYEVTVSGLSNDQSVVYQVKPVTCP